MTSSETPVDGLTCQNCGGPIRIAIFRGGAWCSDDCRKELIVKTQRVLAAVRPVANKTRQIRDAIMAEEGLRVDDA